MKGVDVIGQLLEPATQVADGGEAKTKDGKQFEALLAEAVEQGTQGGKDALPKGKGAGQTTLVGKELPAGKETLTGKEPLATKDPLTSQELLAGKELLAAQAPVVGQERVAGQERFAGQVSVGAQLGESKELPFAKPPQNAADSPRPTRAVGPGPSLDKSRVLELPAAPRSIHSAIQAQASEPGAPPAQDELEANAKLKDAAPAEHVREPQTPEQMQAVLVQVATVVARIVAPPKDTKASVKEGVAASQGNGALSKEAELPSTTPANDVAPPVYPHEFADALSAFELVPHAEHDLSNAVTVRPSADTELTAPEAPSSGDAQGLLGRAAQRLADRGPMRAAADKVMSAFRALSGRGDAPSATTDLPLPPLASTPATAGLTNVAPVNAPEVAPPPSMPAQGVQVSAPGLPPSAPQLPASAPQLPASAPALPASAPQLLASAPALPASAPQLPASASNPLPNARVEPKGVSASAPLTVEVATQSDPTAKPIAQPLAPASPAQTDRTQTPLDVANGTTPGAADTRGPGPLRTEGPELPTVRPAADPSTPNLQPRGGVTSATTQPSPAPSAQPAQAQPQLSPPTNPQVAQSAPAAVTAQAPSGATQQAAQTAIVAAQPTQPVLVQVQQPLAENASTEVARNEPNSGEPRERVHGFARGGWTGHAMSAYGGRGHEGGERGGSDRGETARTFKREEERATERVSETTNPYISEFVQPLQEQQLMQPQPQTPETRAQNVPQNQPAPAAPVQELPDIVFQGRPDPTAATENASISLHHPDLGPIQLEVHREQGRVEVHAVIESHHAQAVLRANENGIRQGVQQAGMTFNALRVRLRNEEQPTNRPAQVRRRRNERET